MSTVVFSLSQRGIRTTIFVPHQPSLSLLPLHKSPHPRYYGDLIYTQTPYICIQVLSKSLFQHHRHPRASSQSQSCTSYSKHTFHISHVLRTLMCYFLPANAPNLVSDFHSPCYTIQMLKMHTVVILCQSSSRFFKSCTTRASSSSIVIAFKGFWWVLNHWTHTVVLLCQSSSRFFKSCTSWASSSSIMIVLKGFWWVLIHWMGIEDFPFKLMFSLGFQLEI